MTIVTIKYAAGHVDVEEWTKLEMYCPECGKQTVHCGDSDDYYAGVQHICTSCEYEFWFYTTPNKIGKHDPDRQRLEQLQK